MGTKNGEFSVKNAYHMAKEGDEERYGGSSSGSSATRLWKEVWKVEGPRVVKNFLWQACNEILPTRSNLFKRRIISDPLCPICRLEQEMVSHILWSCTSNSDVWIESFECTKKLHKCPSTEDALLNIFEMLHERLPDEELYLVIVIMRQIWLRRNEVVFGGL